MTTDAPFRLHGYPGAGSTMIEAQLAIYGLPFVTLDGDPAEDAAARARIAPLNPLLQVPVLELPDGTVMTESAAITLLLADLTGRDDLVPGPQATERAMFLRWLVYIVANIYPCFTFADDPARYVEGAEAAKAFRAAVDERQKQLWLLVEDAARGPWFLGERFSAIDLYVGVMVRWRPGQAWFGEHAPKLAAISAAAAARPEVAAVMARNFT